MSEERPKRLSQKQIQNILSNASGDGSEGNNSLTELGDVFDDAEFEGTNIYATVKFPGGGVFDEQGQHDAAVIREMSGRSDMLLMELDDFDPDALKQIVLDCVDSIGPYTDKSKVAELLFNDLLIGDYLYLIIRIRQLSVGDKYKFGGRCRQCGHVGEYQVLLSDLEYESDDETTAASRQQVNTFSKGPMDWEIHWHYMTEGDSAYLDRANNHMKGSGSNNASQKGSSKGDKSSVDLLTAQMITRIDKIVDPNEDETLFGRNTSKTADGKLTMQESVHYCRELPMWLRVRFSAKVNNVEPGIDPEVLWECVNCEKENSRIVYPLSPDFFLQLDDEND